MKLNYVLLVQAFTRSRNWAGYLNVKRHFSSYTLALIKHLWNCKLKLVMGIVICFLRSVKAWRFLTSSALWDDWIWLQWSFLRSCNENHLLSGSYHLIGLAAAPCQFITACLACVCPHCYPRFLPFPLQLLGNLHICSECVTLPAWHRIKSRQYCVLNLLSLVFGLHSTLL